MTNIILGLVAGSVVGLMCYSFMNLNEKRGLMASIVIGLLGGFFGGNVLAPLFGGGNPPVNPGDFSPFSLFMALAGAAATLIISSMVHKPFGF